MQRKSKLPATDRVKFQTTSWSLVAMAGDSDPEGRRALESLCREYWKPLYAFLRGAGNSRNDAEDLVQGFFLHVLKNGVLQYADPGRGRFRTFLTAAIKQFATREHVRENAQRRKPVEGIVSLDFGGAERVFECRHNQNDSPEDLFDRVWAFTLLDRVRTALRDEYVTAGKGRLFEMISPSLTSDSSLPYDQTAEELQMTEGAVRVAVHRLKQRFGTILRKQIADTVQDASEIDDELNLLMATLGS